MPFRNFMPGSPEWQFCQNGYLLVKSAIPSDEATSYLEEAQKIVDESIRHRRILHERHYHEGSYKVTQALRFSDKFDALIDRSEYFDILLRLMGPYIQLMGTEIFVRGASHSTITGFHTDLGPGMQSFFYQDGTPFWQVKAQIFLTDLSQPDSSNFALIPGSHRTPAEDSNLDCMLDSINSGLGSEVELPAKAIQVTAQAGDVLLFPHSLWHAVGPNRSPRTRLSLTFRYGQLALRPIERFDPILADENRFLTSRQRRLLGDLGEIAPSPYKPKDQSTIMGWDV